MSLLLLVDLVAFSLTMTDFNYLEMSSEMFSCELSTTWSRSRRYLTITTLGLIFSRGIILWLLNLYLFISVIRLSVLRLVSLSSDKSQSGITNLKRRGARRGPPTGPPTPALSLNMESRRER